ncbi:Protein CBG24735 [Caenorhabditis briggsae]|uniref:Protein CBG24735 n=1 Tax=Caenorhabditis briggsae TaxID=6238 RepID=A8WLC9_CAEBR|nr:Protein CBG24735 [Caenorhabditis briggsae]CAP21274.1 Protein CBG24735 [Caenorhabditis briggsae]
MVMKRCCVESLEFQNRYFDYWEDRLCAKKESRETKDFDIDPRLMIMLRESRERVGSPCSNGFLQRLWTEFPQYDRSSETFQSSAHCIFVFVKNLSLFR